MLLPSLIFQAGLFALLCIAGILWILYRKFRRRRPPAKPAAHEGDE